MLWEVLVFFLLYGTWFTIGSPQVYGQVLPSVILALSWSNKEVNKVQKLRPWVVLQSDAHKQLAPKSGDFLLSRNPPAHQCINCTETRPAAWGGEHLTLADKHKEHRDVLGMEGSLRQITNYMPQNAETSMLNREHLHGSLGTCALKAVIKESRALAL